METSQTHHEHETAAPVVPLFGNETLKLTQRAIDKVKQFASADQESPPEGGSPKGASHNGVSPKGFRVYVQGGGCSGFQYGFTLDEKRDGDTVIPAGGIEVLVDTASLQYIKGCQVDFVDDFKGSGFSVTNPNAKANCGCGVSFSV